MWYPWTTTNDYDRTISFADLFRQLDRVARPNAQADTDPATTLLETADGYEFRIDVPGVADKDLTLDVHDQTLTLSARRELKPRDGWSTHRSERSAFAWKRSYAFPTKLDAERTSAKLEAGVLTVRVAKLPDNQPRRVQIGVA